MAKADDIFNDINQNSPKLFSVYESLMQDYYRLSTEADPLLRIPKAQVLALVEMLDAAGYSVHKKPLLRLVG